MRRFGLVAWLLLSGVACANKPRPRDAASAPAEPTAAPATGLAFGDESESAASVADDRTYEEAEPTFEELQDRFEQLDADLSSQGMLGDDDASKKAAGGNSVTTPNTADPGKDLEGRCERICSLKDAICEVSERICALAETHEDDSKYTDACARSETRCDEAATACSSCS